MKQPILLQRQQIAISTIEFLIVLVIVGMVVVTSIPLPSQNLLAGPEKLKARTVVANVAVAKVRFTIDKSPEVLNYYALRDNEIAYSLVKPYLQVAGQQAPPVDILLQGTGCSNLVVNTTDRPPLLY